MDDRDRRRRSARRPGPDRSAGPAARSPRERRQADPSDHVSSRVALDPPRRRGQVRRRHRGRRPGTPARVRTRARRRHGRVAVLGAVGHPSTRGRASSTSTTTRSAARDGSGRASPSWSETWRMPKPTHLAADLAPELRAIWRVLVVELVCGQRRDITGSAAGRRDVAHARQVARMKSGAYTVERPLQLGAAAARRTRSRCDDAAHLRSRDRRGVRPARRHPRCLGRPGRHRQTRRRRPDLRQADRDARSGRANGSRCRRVPCLDRVGPPDLTSTTSPCSSRAGARGVVARVEQMIGAHVQVASGRARRRPTGARPVSTASPGWPTRSPGGDR